MNEPTPQTRKRRKRGCLRLLVLAVFLALGLIAGVWTGCPQRWVLESLLSAALGADVDMESVSLGRRVQIRSLWVGDTGQSSARLTVDSIELQPAWPLLGPRILKQISIEKPVLIISPEGSSQTLFPILSDRRGNREDSANPFRFVPERIEVRGFQLISCRPGLNLRLDGLDVVAELRDVESWEVRVSGVHAAAAWTSPHSASPAAAAGAVEIHAQREGGEILAEGHADYPELLMLAANSRVTLEDKVTDVKIDIPQLILHQAAIGLLSTSVLPFEIRFDEIDFSGTHLIGEFGEGLPRLQDAQVRATATRLDVGPPGAPYFAGDISIEGAGNAAGLELLATFGAGQQARITYSLDEGIGALQVAVDGWTRDQIRAVVPASYLGALDAISNVNSVSGEARIRLDEPPSLESTITATLGDKSQTSIAVQGSVDADVAAFPFAGNANLSYADGHFALETIPAEEETLAFAGEVDKVRIRPWVAAIAPGLAPLPFDGVVNGTVQLKKSPQDWQSQVGLSLDAWEVGGVTLAEQSVLIEGGATVDAVLERASGEILNVTVGEGIELALRDWSVRFRDMQARAKVAGGGDITAIAQSFGWTALAGTVEVDGDVSYADGATTLGGKLRTEDLGYGAFAVPYGQALEITFDGEYGTGGQHFHAKDLQISLGEGSRISGKNVEIDVTDFALKTPEFRCVTDLAPLVAFEYLAEAQGNAEITGALEYDARGLMGLLKGQCIAARLVHGATGAVLEGLDLNAELTLADAVSGNGRLKLDALTVAGVLVSAMETGLHAEGPTVRSDTIQTHVFSGDLEAEAAVDLLAPGMPVRLVLRPKNADLAVFTEQVKPPDVRLTGLASGEIALEFAAGVLHDLEVHLEAPDGFSMNRDMVEWLLLSQYVQDLPMGQSMDKILHDILGKGEQREFEQGKLDLGFAGGRITGQAMLESKSLQLTVDIKADPKALTEALRARQRQP